MLDCYAMLIILLCSGILFKLIKYHPLFTIPIQFQCIISSNWHHQECTLSTLSTLIRNVYLFICLIYRYYNIIKHWSMQKETQDMKLTSKKSFSREYLQDGDWIMLSYLGYCLSGTGSNLSELALKTFFKENPISGIFTVKVK